MEYWTLQEEKVLKKEYNNGASYRQISEFILRECDKVRTIDSIDKHVRKLGLLRRYQKLTKDRKVGHLDIESSQLNASFGFIISWAIKLDGKDEIISDRLTEADFRVKDKLDTDKRVVLSLVDALSKFDVITTYYGEYFDIPFIRSRCLKHGKQFLGYGSLHHVDVWKIARKNMKLHSHRLEAVADHMGVNSKTKLQPSTWARATMGDMKAIKEVYIHNREDVITLEKVYHLLEPYWAGTKKSV